MIVVLPHLCIAARALTAVSGVEWGGRRGLTVDVIHVRGRASLSAPRIRGRLLPRVPTHALRHAHTARRRPPPLLHVAVGARGPRRPVVVVALLIPAAAEAQAPAGGPAEH